MSVSLSLLTARLEDLSAGQRLWFWLATDAVDTPLMVTPTADDPDTDTLRSLALTVQRRGEVTPVVGLGNVDEFGRLHLFSAALTRAHLRALAAFAGAWHAEHPGLERLRDLHLHTVDDDFAVLATLEDESLWADLPHRTLPGSTEEAIEAIRAMAPGEELWVWMTNRGPGRQPFLTISRIPDDPTAHALDGNIRSAIRRSRAPKRSVRCVMRRTADGQYWIAGPGPVRKMVSVLQAALPALPPLNIPDRSQITGESLVEQSAALLGLRPDAQAWFWFWEKGEERVLILAESPEKVRAAAKATRRTGGHSVRGRVRPSRAGWLEFSARADAPALLPGLAKWATANADRWPALHRLKGARMTVRDADDNVIARHRNDALWAAL